MTNWNEVLQFLEPEPPKYCPPDEQPSLTQKVFLRTNAQEALFGGAAGGGKAVLNSEEIPTPSGFRKMEDIHPGDFVLGRDGKAHVVLAESEVMDLPGWKLTFDDGAEVTCNDDHLWLTFDARELEALTKRSDEFRARRREKRPSRSNVGAGQKWNHTDQHRKFLSESISERNRTNPTETKPAPTGTVRTTAEIVATLTVRNGRRNHAVPVTEALDLPERNLLVDPYVLGAWLGDGSARDGHVCSADPEILHNIDEHYHRRWTREQQVNFWVACYEGLRQDLRRISVLGNKHIPHDYLWASEDQRLALLQGLMDTDGTVTKSGSAEFCNTNLHIAEGVAHLARSLGMKATLREGRAKLYGKDCGPKWTVKFMANRIVFRLPRKAALQKIAERRTTKFRYIVSAERVDPQPMKCIKVSSPDHLYLVGEHFIPTHNSSALLMAASQWVHVPGYTALLFRRTFADLALPGALMDRAKDWWGGIDGVTWNANTAMFTFPSGARIGFGYLNNSQDYLRYKGIEAQFIGMDEVSEIRESDYRYLFSRLRRPVSGPLSRVPLRMRAASNPAPNWVRQRFIVEGREYGRVFVPSKLSDNPGIDAESYRMSLSALDPVERRRLEEGDWWATTLGSMFPREDFVLVDPEEVPVVTPSSRMVRYWDMAATEVGPGNYDPDWTVGTLMLFDQGIAWVLDVKRIRAKSDKVEALVAKTAYEDGHAVAIRQEQEGGSSGKAIVDQFARYVVPGYDYQGIRPTGDKQTRARPFAAAVANGNVRVVRGPWLTDWLDELSSFPEAAYHDDQVDSAVGAFTFLTGLGLPQRRRASIIV